MRSKDWFRGALFGFALTAALGAGLTAMADHQRRAARVRVDAQLMDRGLDQAIADLGDLDRLNDRSRDRRVRERVRAKIGDLRANLTTLGAHVDDAIARRERMGDRYRDDDFDDETYVEPSDPNGRIDDREPRRDDRRAISYAMTDAEIDTIVAELGKAYASDAKLAVIRDGANGRWVTTAQLIRLMEELSFSADRVEVAAMLHNNVSDPEAFYQVYRHLPFDSDRDALRKKIGVK